MEEHEEVVSMKYLIKRKHLCALLHLNLQGKVLATTHKLKIHQNEGYHGFHLSPEIASNENTNPEDAK